MTSLTLGEMEPRCRTSIQTNCFFLISGDILVVCLKFVSQKSGTFTRISLVVPSSARGGGGGLMLWSCVGVVPTCVRMSWTLLFSHCCSLGPSVWQNVPWQCRCISSYMTDSSGSSYCSPVSQAQMLHTNKKTRTHTFSTKTYLQEQLHTRRHARTCTPMHTHKQTHTLAV